MHLMDPLGRNMAKFKFPHFLRSAVLAALIAVGISIAAASPVIKGAYYPSSTGDLPPSDIDTTLFTHIFYAFLSPSNITYKFEITNTTAVALSNFTTTLRCKIPPVKTLLSIGGAGEEVAALFAALTSSCASRQAFINSSIELARKAGFDGLDLDWESPRKPEEMDNLAHLLEEWRAEVQREAQATEQPPLLLTAATYFAVDFFLDEVYRVYPAASIMENLDWINVMCYDYHGPWSPSSTGPLAAFFDPTSNISSIHGLKSWLQAGLPRDKVVMGLPLYGRTWQLKDPNITGIGAPAVGAGPGGGVLTYSQVEEFKKNNTVTVVFDANTVSTYSFWGTSWVGYDNVASSMVKIGLAQALGLRGYFFWALTFENDWEISSQASRVWILED